MYKNEKMYGILIGRHHNGTIAWINSSGFIFSHHKGKHTSIARLRLVVKDGI